MKDVFSFLAYRRRVLWTVVLSAVSVAVAAQTAIGMQDLPYFCDFEDDAENANWVLNPGIDLITTPNAWCIGEADAYTGDKGLYVSADGGASTTYAPTSNVLIAYRDISLDKGEYDIAFDWKGMGAGRNGYLKVVFAARSTASIVCGGNSSEPAWVEKYSTSLMDAETSLQGTDAWRHLHTTLKITRANANVDDTRIFFVWVNNTSPTKAPSTVVIDNFQLAKVSTTYPSGLHVSTYLNTSTVNWQGDADSYEVLYRPRGQEEFTSVSTTDPAVVINNVASGAYEFWICGIHDADKSIYSVFPLVYLYNTDCFDVLNMYGAEFEYGSWSFTGGRVVKNVDGTSRVDYGYKDARSRHTTHFDTEEIDPRTIVVQPDKKTYGLRTVPEGEFGSVRLGNWNWGSEYEQMQFHYTVASDLEALLLLRYAIVLENPNHSAVEQPRFALSITDTSGKSVNPKCGDVDFHSPTQQEWNDPAVRALWHTATYGTNSVYWQDWRTVGINLAEYVGQELIITLTTYDCEQGGHYGYAYFTLSCSRTDVDGIPWGDDAETQQFTAPAGFNYAWFNVQDVECKDTLGTTRVFYVAETDENDYICHVTYPTNPDCGFMFEASAKPHSPVAEIQYEWVPKDCKNGVFVKNASHIGLLHRSTGKVEHRYDWTIENCRWTMPDGSVTTEPLYEGFYVPMPDEGGTLTYSMWAGVYVNDSVFQDSVTVEIEVPAIGSIEVHQEATLCSGESIEFPVGSGTTYRSRGDYFEKNTSLVTGCDSTTWLHLNVIQPLLTDIYDTICAEGERWFVDEYVSEPRIHKKVLTAATTGCDSIITLHLAKAARPVVSLQNSELCGDEALVFDVAHSEWVDSVKIIVAGQGEYSYLGRQADMRARIDPFSIRANSARYTAQVLTYMSWCEAYVDTCSFNIDLSSYIVEVVLDNIFAIRNTESNGGYDMVAFQWYADGEKIPDATNSVFYAKDMPRETVYTVQVTLRDGTPLWICPFTLESRTPIENTTQDAAGTGCRKYLRDGHIYIEVNGRTYTLTGNRITTF